MVNKAIIPVAGFGTRFLPATKSIPKNMIPVLDRPAIHYAVAEASAAGIQDIILVVSKNQETIERYFETNVALEKSLNARKDEVKTAELRAITNMARVTSVIQNRQLGLGHAVLVAKDKIGDEPFAVFLPDDIIWGEKPTIRSMIEQFLSTGENVIAVKEVADPDVPFLGIVDARAVSDREYLVNDMVEKPSLEETPSNLAIIGRYVLSPVVFDILANIEPGAVGEIQLTDAIKKMIITPGVRAYKFPGRHFDVGTPLGLLKASIFEALQRADTKDEITAWMKTTISEHYC